MVRCAGAAALSERQVLLERRAAALGETALSKNDRWTWRLGPPPTIGSLHDEWLRGLRTVAAYRDRYAIGTESVLGDVQTDAQASDFAIAERAIRNARRVVAEYEINSLARVRHGVTDDRVI